MAYVVRNIEPSMSYWTDVLGVGPFFYLKDHEAKGSTYRGRPTNMRISLAFAQSGNLQIELVQQLNDAPSLFQDFSESGREGLQHVAFWTYDFDDDIARYLAAGYVIVQTAGLHGPNNRNAFIEKPGQPTAIGIEISEIRGSKGIFFDKIKEAAQAWDGSDPIRDV